MSGEQLDIKKSGRKRKRFLKIISVLAFLAVSIHFILFFAADWLFREYIQQQVEHVSKGKYSVDFDRVYLSLFQRGLFVEKFELVPTDPTIFDALEIPYYKISVDQLDILGLNFIGEDGKLTADELRLTAPMIQSKQQLELTENKEFSPLKQLEYEIKKSLNGPLKEIFINDFYIDQANFLVENFLSQKSIAAQNTNLYLKNIHLTGGEEENAPFGIEGFQLNFDDFEISLADSIHKVMAEKVAVSSLEKQILASKVRVTPNLEKTADVYYEIFLEKLALTDADIMEMFQTSKVAIGDLNLNAPHIVLYTDRNAMDEEARTTDMYDLVEDLLESITIKTLTIDDGQFLQRGVHNPNKNRIEADEIQFSLEEVYLGQDEELKKDNFLYARNATLEIDRARIALADGVHWISGHNIYLSTIDDKVRINEIALKPEVNVDSIAEASLFEIKVPLLEFANANLRKVYNENIIDIGELLINAPDVVIKDILGTATADNNPSQMTDLQQLTKGFFKAVYVQKLEVENGSLVLDNHLRVRQDSLAFGKINFLLENFQLDDKYMSDTSLRIFLADNLRLEIEDYALKLSDNLHLFVADKILIDTQKNLLHVDGFKLKPFSPEAVLPLLDKYGRTTVLDIEIPEFSATGVDINQAYFQNKLFINHIDIPSPIIHWTKYIPKENEKQEKLKRGDVLDLITSYFKVISIDSLSTEKGTFNYENFANEQFRSFAENDISVKIRNFYLDENINPAANRTLFSDEVDVNLNNYLFNLANGKYSIVAGSIGFNSAREEINTFDVKLMPNKDLKSKVSIEASFPDLSFSGVDLEAFLFDNTLALTKLRFSDAEVNLSINRAFNKEEEKPNEEKKKSRNLPKTIDVIKIDSILATNGSFNVANYQEGNDLQLINTGINIAIADFLLDSTRLSNGDIASFFSTMALDVDNFSLALKDSVHTVTFSKIQLDSRKEEILIENVNVVPKEAPEKLQGPVIKAHIPQISINTRSLTSFQKTGELDVSLLRLTDPEVNLYLSKNEPPIELPNGQGKEISRKILESILIRNFKLNGGSFALIDKSDTIPQRAFKNLRLILSDLNFDFTQKQQFNSDFFFNEDFRFEFKDYELNLPDSLNKVSIGKLMVSKDKLILNEVRFLPRVGLFAYAREVGKQTDVMELYVPKIIIEGLNLKRFIAEEKVEALSMTLEMPQLEVFRDKRIEEDTTVVKLMPQQLMELSKQIIELDTLIVKEGMLTYREFPVKGMVPGEITFDQFNAKMYPFRLGKFGEDRKKPEVEANFRINKVAPVKATVQMQFEDPYPIAVEAEVGAFDLPSINSILATNAFITVKRGMVREGKWHFVVDKNEAIGEMTLKYNKLKVQLLDERTLKDAGGRKGILTFVINALALRKNNPRPIFNRLVSSPIYVERIPYKFVFNYMWKATFSGLMGSSGLMQPKIPKNEEEEDES
ncbi:hypothetical protein [Cyclobacterium marinum]|uniref:DUF748 domain-containing protein n=1 Tax=Cyclobacterium marinum (strain ATCC 25205 / DSM 745 / LMG 13164 / NCIMB 1802) TaxID=880070 RepID=G0IUQ1_CYCMS|nr:hypothetical protein [Cyclobacterium marinum]AEL25443.1 hypothetical protein Cycma_1689 [Cyclobacterium marinum DSM 745]